MAKCVVADVFSVYVATMFTSCHAFMCVCVPCLQAWHCGGYSDDLVLASVVTEQGLAIAVPSSAIFPQWWAPELLEVVLSH